MQYSGRGGGRGGGRNQIDGKIRISGTDRYCASCGSVLKGLATTNAGIFAYFGYFGAGL